MRKTRSGCGIIRVARPSRLVSPVTPQGIFELKYFFNTGISRRGGDELASEAVKTKIKILIDNENPAKPYSDQKIVELLKKDGVMIARRTVAKYREAMGILPSSKRKQLF